MKRATKILLLLMVCIMVFGSTLSAYAGPVCCAHMNISTRYEPAHPGTYIINYCTNCEAIHSRKWIPQGMN
ncbi:hypothetical protein RBU61_09000 [Tissierella sp. MB52-C2]|uniref:hypothetical protein n=1 Tax=Tissierella sp. MB52-C2 TaxID=3070999 RepID=UPI00280AF57F|nr:hypothetical protein [Tissierella sp. MB52-C2]WMM26802.1 hypothetical protein RBU61_09000 [Tissierella sp. MB52-C2]